MDKAIPTMPGNARYFMRYLQLTTCKNSAYCPAILWRDPKQLQEIYQFLNSYLIAITTGFRKRGINSIAKPTLFKAVMQFFPNVARLVNGDYSVDSFSEVLAPLFERMTVSKVQKATSIKTIVDHFSDCINKGFML